MEIKDILIKDIRVIENIRRDLKEKEMPFLMTSIKENGLLQPIGVKKERMGYTLIWGFRRMLAFQKLGYRNIPAIIFVKEDEEMSEEEFFVLNATENMQRKPNTLLEFGRICKILRKTMGNGEIAAKLGVPKSRVDAALTEISRIPLKWHKKIKMMDGSEKKGDIPLSAAAKVGAFRGITTAQKNELLNWLSRDEIELVKLSGAANLMKKGMSFSEAKKNLNKYKTYHLKIMVEAEKFSKIVKDYGSETAFFIEAINKLAKDDIAVSFADTRGVRKTED